MDVRRSSAMQAEMDADEVAGRKADRKRLLEKRATTNFGSRFSSNPAVKPREKPKALRTKMQRQAREGEGGVSLPS